jgi:hypothetical protein
LLCQSISAKKKDKPEQKQYLYRRFSQHQEINFSSKITLNHFLLYKMHKKFNYRNKRQIKRGNVRKLLNISDFF